jgi:hypothetical protein
MFSSLAALPLVVQLSLIICAFIAAIVLAFLGKVNIKLGKYNFNFGKAFRPISKSRSCQDCRSLVMIRIMKFDQEVKLLKDDILRDQMNYAEQKIQESSYTLTTSYRDNIVHLRKQTEPIDSVRENKEYILYRESLACALHIVHDEIRKAFKENGFVEFNNQEFLDYVKGKTKLLISIGREYIRSRYPFENMIVPIEWRFDRLPEPQIEAAVYDLFSKAKQIKLLANEKIEQLGQEYDKDIVEFSDNISSKK